MFQVDIFKVCVCVRMHACMFMRTPICIMTCVLQGECDLCEHFQCQKWTKFPVRCRVGVGR